MSLPRPDCLLIEGCDFESFPPGGQLSSAKLMVSAFGERLALVGIATDDTPVGRWVDRTVCGKRLHFYAVGRRKISASRPLVPARLTHYLRLQRHREGILGLGVRAAFLQAPEELMVVSRWGLESLCYRFPGVENPLEMARYRWARPLAGWFDRHLFDALQRTQVILASADEAAIRGLIARSRGALTRERVIQASTHFDSATFTPRDRREARSALGISPEVGPLLVVSGRINRVKGWDLLLEAMVPLRSTHPGAMLVFVGDGEDRRPLLRRAEALGVDGQVRVTGFLEPPRVAAWMGAADLVLVGSHREGWSVTMLEALGCARPLVSTDVSGARAMVHDGKNGFVVAGREPGAYAEAVRRALRLEGAGEYSLGLSRSYDLGCLARQMRSAWSVLA